MVSKLIKNSCEHTKNFTRYQQNKTMILVIFVTLCAMLLASCISNSYSKSHEKGRQISSTPTKTPYNFHPLIKKTCTNTLYPALCFASLALVRSSESASNFHHILEISINRASKSVKKTRLKITRFHKSRVLNSKERNALSDCLELLEQTVYELGQATEDLRAFPLFIEYLPRSYGNFKSLLSAAMTNENTCIDGFSELEKDSVSKNRKKGLLKQHLQNMLSPISRRISNCLAIIKYMETINKEKIINEKDMLITNIPQGHKYPTWMKFSDWKLNIKTGPPDVRPNLTVARDGTGDYRSIGEAVDMAPDKSMFRFVIKIKAGVYKESVVISRHKVNIMLVGDGMKSTVITGSKNFVDGYSTFTSATLTVIGDKFIARDLTVENTSGPEKHQAVALKVTSNSAFYRCNFSAYQDTLYVHSLRQFYRECTIQGTVDFIFGNAAAVFQNCYILIRKPLPSQKNMITAQGRGDPNQNTGIILQNCIIMAAPNFTESDTKNFSTFLGRPWRNYSRTVIMKSYLGDLINTQGWYKWNQYSSVDKVEYIEFRNFGPGSNTEGRVTWGGYKKNCSAELIEQFAVGAFLHGADDWLESTRFPLSPGSSRRHVQ